MNAQWLARSNAEAANFSAAQSRRERSRQQMASAAAGHAPHGQANLGLTHKDGVASARGHASPTGRRGDALLLGSRNDEFERRMLHTPWNEHRRAMVLRRPHTARPAPPQRGAADLLAVALMQARPPLVREAQRGGPAQTLRAHMEERALPIASATASAASARLGYARDEQERAWRQYDGEALESLVRVDLELGDSPVRLLDARFLISLAEQGGRLPRRQDVPTEAFIDLDTLRRMPTLGAWLRVVCVSHPWLQPDHPDPRGDTLGLVAHVLRYFIKQVNYDCRTGFYEQMPCAVFFDFASIFQKGPKGAESILPTERALALRAKQGIGELYAHPYTFTLMVTKLPPGYPRGFSFPDAYAFPNIAQYRDRGWCACEAALSCLTKSRDLVLDLGKVSDVLLHRPSAAPKHLRDLIAASRADRQPPLTPREFETQQALRTFMDKSIDLPTVNLVYELGFEGRFMGIESLDYSGLAWDNDAVAQLCQVMADRALQHCHSIDLSSNRITDDGMVHLFLCLQETRVMPLLRHIELANNPASWDATSTVHRLVANRVEAIRRALSALRFTST